MIVTSAAAADDIRAGGKARALGHLAAAGHRVPAFCVVIDDEVTPEVLVEAALSLGPRPLCSALVGTARRRRGAQPCRAV